MTTVTLRTFSDLGNYIDSCVARNPNNKNYQQAQTNFRVKVTPALRDGKKDTAHKEAASIMNTLSVLPELKFNVMPTLSFKERFISFAPQILLGGGVALLAMIIGAVAFDALGLPVPSGPIVASLVGPDVILFGVGTYCAFKFWPNGNRKATQIKLRDEDL